MSRRVPFGACALVAVSVLFIPPGFAAGIEKGQGGIVIRDDAPVFKKPTGDVVVWRLKKGDAVVGSMGASAVFGGVGCAFMFDEKEGRLHVAYFQGEAKGLSRSGWMDPADLSKFFYSSCDDRSCTPYLSKGFSLRWNGCFQEARDAKLEKLQGDGMVFGPPSTERVKPKPDAGGR